MKYVTRIEYARPDGTVGTLEVHAEEEMELDRDDAEDVIFRSLPISYRYLHHSRADPPGVAEGKEDDGDGYRTNENPSE